jgi:cell division septal protein FtsQ
MFKRADKRERLNLTNPKTYNPPAEEKEFKFPKILIILFLFIVIAAILTFILVLSPVFKIQNIEVKGTLPDEAQTYLDGFKGQNIFLIKSSNIADALKTKYPEYLDVSVYKGIPNVLKITFDERDAVLVWQTGSQNYLVDDTGLAFKKLETLENNSLPVVVDAKNIVLTIPSQVVTENFIKFVTDAKVKIKDAGLTLKQFEINETFFQVDAVTDTGLKIKFDISRTLTDQMDAFNKVYGEHKADIKQYIDLRVPGKVYYQ